MEAVRTHKSLLVALLFGISVSMVPTQLDATIITKKRVAIAVPIAALLLLCSENARTLTTKAYYKSKIAALRLLQHCPFSDSMQQKITNNLEQTEALYTTRSGSSFTGENLKTLLKEFKDLVDACKAGKDVYGWMQDN